MYLWIPRSSIRSFRNRIRSSLSLISGAHLYGFPSPDSDFDLRGAHVLPVHDVIGLDAAQDTIEVSTKRDGLEIDLVTHDVKKFFLMLLKKNGYVLEQLYSPLILKTSPEHEELKAIAKNCITRHHVYHYANFANTQWELLEKQTPPTVKALLYVYRVLLTGIHLMQTGEIEASLVRLNETLHLSYIGELILRKTTLKEKVGLSDTDLAFHRGEVEKLRARLQEAHENSTLPESPSARRDLNALLIRLRTTFPS
jgi:predicted nucleotidyltransferase